MQPKFKSEQIKLIIGLGNPGEEYKETYHNVGELAVQNFAEEPAKWGRSSSGTFTYLKLKNIKLVKSQVFMNMSGLVTRETAKYFKVAPEEILIIHDDSDLSLGSYKISF